MTEKHYGGSSGIPGPEEFNFRNFSRVEKNYYGGELKKSSTVKDQVFFSEFEKAKKAGEIAVLVREYAKSFIKADMLLLDVANKIDEKIYQLGAKPAFPVNLSINEIAAHDTPFYNDERRVCGLLKVDIGVHIDGFIADTAFSLDFENSDENNKLINAVESGLSAAIGLFDKGVSVSQIGEVIEKNIKKHSGAVPIYNLSGHSIQRYDLHAGLNIPNYNNSSNQKISFGIYAIEPFATFGVGQVRDGKLSGIYVVQKDGSVRDSFAREVLCFIRDEYKTLPFCSRWIVKKFGVRALLALRRIEEAGILHNYPQLVEKSGKNVSQAEHTILISHEGKIVTTL